MTTQPCRTSVDIAAPPEAVYLELDPPHRLLISWGHTGSAVLPPGTSTVEITLSPIPQGTRVSVEHRDLPPDEATKHAIGWAHFLGRLTDAAIGHDPGPDPCAQTIPERAAPSPDG